MAAAKPSQLSRARLSPGEVKERQGRLAAPWRLEDGALVGEWTFGDFDRVARMTRAVIALSERVNHHPEVQFGYKHFRIRYITHSAGGLSELDFYCAAEVSVAADL